MNKFEKFIIKFAKFEKFIIRFPNNKNFPKFLENKIKIFYKIIILENFNKIYENKKQFLNNRSKFYISYVLRKYIKI